MIPERGRESISIHSCWLSTVRAARLSHQDPYLLDRGFAHPSTDVQPGRTRSHTRAG